MKLDTVFKRAVFLIFEIANAKKNDNICLRTLIIFALEIGRFFNRCWQLGYTKLIA